MAERLRLWRFESEHAGMGSQDVVLVAIAAGR